MPRLFHTDIAGIVNKALGQELTDVVVIRKTQGLRADNLTGGIQSSEDEYRGRGLVYDYKDRQIDGSLIRVGDRKVMILGASIAIEPQVNDLITVEGKTYFVVRSSVDPAGAAYECQVR